MKFFKLYDAEFLGVILCLSLGLFFGYVAQTGDSIWYANLTKPIFNPPNFIFGPMWSLLYIMIGIAFGKIWKNNNKSLLCLFILQFILNLLWSPIFFYFHRIDIALYDILLLWATIVFLMIFAYQQRLIFALFVPYILWVSFALVLNFSIYRLNITN